MGSSTQRNFGRITVACADTTRVCHGSCGPRPGHQVALLHAGLALVEIYSKKRSDRSSSTNISEFNIFLVLVIEGKRKWSVNSTGNEVDWCIALLQDTCLLEIGVTNVVANCRYDGRSRQRVNA